MLEIPESLTIAKQLNETVKGLKIRSVEAAHTKHSFAWYTGEPDFYAKVMEGKKIGEAAGWGSYLEISLGDYRFAVGDGTNLRYYGPDEKPPGRYQTRIALEDGSSLVCTVQMYGSMFLIRPEEYDNFYYQVAKEKPMPGTEDFDYAYFQELKKEASGTLSMKAFLATEQRIPGLGNGVLQDILLRAGLHPKKKMGTVPESRWRQVYQALTDTLETRPRHTFPRASRSSSATSRSTTKATISSRTSRTSPTNAPEPSPTTGAASPSRCPTCPARAPSCCTR